MDMFLFVGIFPYFVLVFTIKFGLLDGKVCYGTDNGVSHTVNTQAKRIQDLANRFTNCSKVEGNLELVYLTGDNVKLNFFKTIEEVTGYVLIVSTYARVAPFSKLKIIRGETLFMAKDPDTHEMTSYSLYIAMNQRDSISEMGLHELHFPSLTEITTGSVLIRSNRLLCHVKDILWDDLMNDPGSKVHVMQDKGDNNRFCEECPKNCRISNRQLQNKSHCWTTKLCQKLNKVVCAKNCKGRCYGHRSDECCHEECSAGCKGSSDEDCFFCKHFKDENRCVSTCPPITIFDHKLKKLVFNPRGKFVHQSRCLNKCPGHMLVDSGACVVNCGEGLKVGPNNTCVPCVGECPKTCSVGDNDWIHSGNIDDFVNCTSVRGPLQILDVSFDGDRMRNILPMNRESLSKLDTIEDISDYLEINTKHDKLENLTFLKNLKFIHGRNTKTQWSLIIQSTKLKYLGFESLMSIKNGGILISGNIDLCYVESFHWSAVAKEGSKIVVVGNKDNAICEEEGSVCSSECTTEGCTGGSNRHCKECLHVKFGKKCLSNCINTSIGLLLYEANGTKTCSLCHPQCLGGCYGPNNDECSDDCRNVRDDNACVERCGTGKYADEERICWECSPLCAGGCHGNNARVGRGGCNKCLLSFLDPSLPATDDESYSIECIRPFNETQPCPDGFYLDLNSKEHSEMGTCKKCHANCLTCSGPGSWLRLCSCLNFIEDDRCVDECSQKFYVDGRNCRRCNDACSSCHGPDEGDCLGCSGFAVVHDQAKLGDNNSYVRINCTETCPSDLSYIQNVGPHMVCVKQEFADRPSRHVILWMTPLIVFAIVLFIVVILRSKLFQRKLKTNEKSTLQREQTSIDKLGKPDMSRLKLVNENELKRGIVIGSGAFGTVYKGFWMPTGKKIKISVAIKVLQDENDTNDGRGRGDDPLLEEARIMASVVHPYCVHILAVCLTSPMMLVTQLMPLGCLLEYVKKNETQIGSRLLLNWSLQIAKGMHYLEQNNIVHRDLAARNVLLQSVDHVKITDFGLAKMVDSNVGEFRSTGGKLPIKWLAPESIKNHVFSHKSDVWSYGVTLWELFTFGHRPYDNVPVGTMLQLLEKGERLPQPEICTIDVYMFLIKCWLVEASNRPCFKDLFDEFGVMVQDPGQYLSIRPDVMVRSGPKLGNRLQEINICHQSDETTRRNLSEDLTEDNERNDKFHRRQSSIKTCLIQKKAKLYQKVASCKQLGNLPLEKLNNFPRWKLGRHATINLPRETSFTACRYSPSPHFAQSSPRVQVPAHRFPKSVSSPADLINSPSSEYQSMPWPVHRDSSDYLRPNDPIYLQLIDNDDREERHNGSIVTQQYHTTKEHSNQHDNESHLMSFDNLEYFIKNYKAD